MRVLIVEDQQDMAEVLKEELVSLYAVDDVQTGLEAIYLADVNPYDLIILDLGLPDMDGLDVCKKIRQSRADVAILVLTGRYEISDRVAALDAGADDYLMKPYSLAELLARVRALLRRGPALSKAGLMSVEDLIVNPSTRSVTRSGTYIPLRRKEYEILEFLIRNKGAVVSREMLLEHLWDENLNSLTNVVDVHIKNLRDKIDKPYSKHLITTVHGLGYKIVT